MPTVDVSESVHVHYDVEGRLDGFPVLLIAPGGMHSHNALWNDAAWNPRVALADEYRLIGMDQRNAGASVAPVRGSDSWATFAADQIALLDNLGIERCHALGMCIGGPYVLALLAAAPARFESAVLLQPAGVANDSSMLRGMFDQWAAASAPAHPETSPTDWASFGDNMWDGDFVLSVTRDEVAACTNPILVMMGNDEYHPQSVSREIVALAQNATLVERWKDAEMLPVTDATIKTFFAEHTPAAD